MATGVQSWSQTAADNATADSNVNWAEGMAPSAVNNSARAEMSSVAKYRDDTAGTLTTGGTSTAYTLTTNQVFASLAELDGNELTVKFNATNGAAATLAVDGLAAKAINGTSGSAITTGSLLANTIHRLTYDNANSCFVVNSVFPVIINQITAVTVPAADDELPMYDASVSANRKITLSNMMKVITFLTAETAPATDDEIAIYDTSASTADKMTLLNLWKVINSFTEDTAPVATTDFVATYDASASAAKKVLVGNLGSVVLIQSQSASSSATIDFTTGLDDTSYDGFEIRFDGVKPATDDVALWLRIGTGGGPTYQTSGYKWLQNQFVTGTGITAIGDNAAGQMVLTNAGSGGSGVGNASGEHVSGIIRFSNPEASDFPVFNIDTRWRTAAGNLGAVNEVAEYSTAGAITGLRLMFSSGNIASGRIALYGYKKA
jgi:hypothetical protein